MPFKTIEGFPSDKCREARELKEFIKETVAGETALKLNKESVKVNFIASMNDFYPGFPPPEAVKITIDIWDLPGREFKHFKAVCKKIAEKTRELVGLGMPIMVFPKLFDGVSFCPIF